MLVSVVIPTYNCGPLVVEAIASILAQTRSVDEIIVVDDGSTDDTATRMDQFSTRVRYIRKENGGVSSARNRGVEEAKGEWIAFLDADDVWHPRKMEIQFAAIEKHPILGLLGANVYVWPGDHPEVSLQAADHVYEVHLHDLIVRNTLITSTIIVRTEAIRAAGPFDRSLQGPEDYDLWIRVAQRTQVANLHIALSGYRHTTPGSLSKNVVRMETGMRAILEKVEASGLFWSSQLLRRKAWGYYWYTCGSMRLNAGDATKAMSHAIRSLLRYPLPYGRDKVSWLGRLRLLAAAALRWMRTRRMSATSGTPRVHIATETAPQPKEKERNN